MIHQTRAINAVGGQREWRRAMALLGYVMTRLDYPIAPAALAIVLGYLLEKNLRVGLIMTDGVVGFVSRPITAGLLLFALLSILAPAILAYRRRAIRRRDH